MDQETPMGQAKAASGSNIVAVYSDRASAEEGIALLHRNGFRNQELSIIGRNIQVTEEPSGFVSTGEYVSAGARSGAVAGAIAGVALGAALLVLPGVGPIVVAGPVAAAILAGIEGAIGGACLGALSGALVAWGVPREHALRFESEIKGGKFLVLVRANATEAARARALLVPTGPEHVAVFEPS
jgi:uncharacterized membrane protein